MEEALRKYFKPTPILMRKIGDALLGVSTFITGYGIIKDHEWVALIALFVGNGLCLLSVRGYRQTGIQGEESLFLGILFSTAAVVSNATWLLRREGSSRRDIAPGMMLGICNALANLSLVAALQQLPGVLVFPFYSSVGLVFAAAFAGVVWRERISRIEAAGMAVAVGAVGGHIVRQQGVVGGPENIYPVGAYPGGRHIVVFQGVVGVLPQEYPPSALVGRGDSVPCQGVFGGILLQVYPVGVLIGCCDCIAP